MRNRRNYYRVLHVQPDAPREIIRMSYLTLMSRLRMHPDLGGDHWNAAVINEAFATLSDQAARAAYDRTLRHDVVPVARRAPTSGHSGGAVLALGTGQRTMTAHRCAFCDAPHPPGSATRADALCDICASPLCLAAAIAHTDAGQRALTRIPRASALTLIRDWPRHDLFSGATEDVSIAGMRLTSPLELVPGERLKLDCAFCAAVGEVRHVRAADAPHPRWTAGVEFLTLFIKDARGGFVSIRA